MSASNRPKASPWKIGWESAKANFVPGVILQIVSAALVLGYYFSPGFAQVLEPLNRWQTNSGGWAAFISRGFFGGIMPGLFMVALPSLRPRRFLATVILSSIWWGFAGLVTSWFYYDQQLLFGAGHNLVTLLEKALFDQFVFTILYAVPVNGTFNFWIGCDLSCKKMREVWPRSWVRELVLPNLLPNWAIWFPAMFIIYALPEPLQVQISGMIGCFWSLMCLQIGRRIRLQGDARE